jgi:CheY-like chemotaxis protein
MAEQKKILVVEDEGLIRRALVDQLEREKFHTLSAENGEEGFDQAKKEHPDLILLDVVMPVMDGITASKKLENNPETKHIPVVFLTNLSDSQDVHDKITREKYEFLVKADWDINDVIEKVKTKLGD